MQEHAEAVHHFQAVVLCHAHDRRDQRRVDDIGHHRTGGHFREVDPGNRCAFHAERARIYEKPGACGDVVQGIQRVRADSRAEAVRQLRGPRDRAVDDVDLPHAAIAYGLDDRPAGAAGAEDDGGLRPVPARRPFIEIGAKAVAVRVGRHQPAVLQPQRVGRTEFARQRIGPTGQFEGGLLVRDRDIAADETAAAIGKRFHECGKILRRHRDGFVAAVDAGLPQPVTMDHGRAGVFYRISGDEGANRLSHRSPPDPAMPRAAAASAGR